MSPLLEDEGISGLFYGTTFKAGTTDDGTIFKIETTVEAPKLNVRGSLRPRFRSRTLRLRGTATDDLGVTRVEYATKTLFRPAKGTTAWNARIPVRPAVKRVTVKIRSVDSETLVSALKTVRARRAS